MPPEAGVLELTSRIEQGKFKVASHLSEWFEEFRLYHRRDGKLVSRYDDLLSATRQVIMGQRYAAQIHLGPTKRGQSSSSRPQIADGVDYDVFNPYGDQDVFG